MRNFKILITVVLVLGTTLSSMGQNATYSFVSHSSSGLLYNDGLSKWEILESRETFFKVSISPDNVEVLDGINGNSLLNTGLELVDVSEDAESTTFVFEESNSSGGVIQLLIKREGYRVDGVVGYLWVSSRKVGKGILLELSLPKVRSAIYNSAE